MKQRPHLWGLSPKLSPPVRGAWIETEKAIENSDKLASPPVRGAWIETFKRVSKRR